MDDEDKLNFIVMFVFGALIWLLAHHLGYLSGLERGAELFSCPTK